MKQIKCEIVLSDMNQSGEGEFKIMNELRTMSLTEKDLVMVVSPDADMIQ